MAEGTRGTAGSLVGLKRQVNDIADGGKGIGAVFGRAVIGPLHGEDRPTVVAGPVLGSALVRTCVFDPFFHLTHACEILVELRLIGAAALPVRVSGMFLDPAPDRPCAVASLVVVQAVG